MAQAGSAVGGGSDSQQVNDSHERSNHQSAIAQDLCDPILRSFGVLSVFHESRPSCPSSWTSAQPSGIFSETDGLNAELPNLGGFLCGVPNRSSDGPWIVHTFPVHLVFEPLVLAGAYEDRVDDVIPG